MTIKSWQKQVDQWIKEYGVRYFDIMTNTLLLTEEMGELSRVIARRYGEQSFKHPTSDVQADEQIKDEVADIFFVLTCICNTLDIDITNVLQHNMEKKTVRDATRHQHLRDSGEMENEF